MATTQSQQNGTSTKYSLQAGTKCALQSLLHRASKQIPAEIRSHTSEVIFSSSGGNQVYFPCPFKETEAASALKAVEASAATAIADIRYGRKKRKIDVDLERASCFLFAAYLSTIDGMDKGNMNGKSKLKDTDLLQAQSILYRRLSANLYETRNPGEYFHLHGSLEATIALNMVGLEGSRPDMTDYHECIKLIEDHVKQFSAAELEEMNAEKRQAGVTCLKWEEFQKTEYGQGALEEPPWVLEALEKLTPPVPFPDAKSPGGKLQPLAGIRVLELCRIIAGPAIGRTLAEYGADVIKVTSAHLSDVPFFQVDGNMGKHTLDLDLRDPRDRQSFESLLSSTDILLDGYRPGALTRLGYGPSHLTALAKSRNKGIVYIAESCFGASPPSHAASKGPNHETAWSQRPGWQQIADCVTGVAWAQGVDGMGLNEPVVPPFPMSDYGTGCAGAIAVLTGLFHRATVGGSWWGGVSLVGYDVFLLSLGLYPASLRDSLRKEFSAAGFEGLQHNDSVDEVGKKALVAMRTVRPELFSEKHCHEAWSQGYGARVKYVKSAVAIEGLRNGFSRGTRPNGFDKATWEGWEGEDEFLDVI